MRSIDAARLNREDDKDVDSDDDDDNDNVDDDDDDDEYDDDDQYDVATDYNLSEFDNEIDDSHSVEVTSLHTDDECDTDCSLDTELSFPAPVFSPCRTDEVSDVQINDSELLEAAEHLDEEIQTNTLSWKGFKIVGDNIDKNIKPSFKRYDNKTDSIHYFHHYALLDRLDLSAYTEVLPTTPLDLSKLLVSRDDVCQLENHAIILLSRYITN